MEELKRLRLELIALESYGCKNLNEAIQVIEERIEEQEEIYEPLRKSGMAYMFQKLK